MDYRITEVYKFFLVLERYAFGDLQLLHKLTKKAEAKDVENEEENSNMPPTTMYPHGFEFNFGKSVHCRATIPFALMIFSCMDIIGFLVRKTPADNAHKETEKNIENFYEHISSTPTEDELKCLIRLFRHGLAHNYFPKLGQSISYHSTNPNTLFFSDNSGICLNVNLLEKHLKEGFYKIRSDERLYLQMETNLTDLNTYYLTHEKCKLLSP